MAMIYNFGSINVDHVYQVPHWVAPGETLAATDYARFLGGKGANQSVAIARAGAEVAHIGAINQEDQWIVKILQSSGVDTQHIELRDCPSGHAIINIDPSGENCIVIVAGANATLSDTQIDNALTRSNVDDLVLIQNETNAIEKIASRCKERGLGVAFNPAPFDAEKTASILNLIDILIVNETEARQLQKAIGSTKIAVPELLTTLGSKGCRLQYNGETIESPAFVVDVKDTTGAGDTFIGYYLAAISSGLEKPAALERASAAAALSVSRAGAAQSIPVSREVEKFIDQ